MAEENERKNAGTAERDPVEEPLPVETGARPRWQEILRQVLDKVRREQQVTSRRELGRDRSRSLFLLAGLAIAVLLLFLGMFSSPNRPRKLATVRPPGTPNLGQQVTPSQQTTGQTGSATPLLNAQTHSEVSGSQEVTAEDVGKTARPSQPSLGSQSKFANNPVSGKTGPYALGKIDFSDVAARPQAAETATLAVYSESADLRKPSVVFVRSVQTNSASGGARTSATAPEESPVMLQLPAGTKLIARLESVVNSAIKTPVVAAIEYNYERDGEIVVPAGAKAVGSFQQADRSGNVAIRFDTIQMLDGTTEKIDAAAMSLTFGPLKGVVSGKKAGTNFLVRTFTGLGQAATYLVGSGGPSAPLSESAFLRDRIATNMGTAGDQELRNLTFNQNIVVTVPGNTRFYIVVTHGAVLTEEVAQPAAMQRANNASLPTVEEFRQLLQLRQELSDMYQQVGTQSATQQVPQR